VPNYPVQLAALVVRIYRLFSDTTAKARSDAVIADVIMSALSEPVGAGFGQFDILSKREGP
jgi:hypothetical protein